MHRATATPEDPPPDPDPLLDLPDEPHAAIATGQPSVASMSATPRWRLIVFTPYFLSFG
jgi:hypothetical protein